MKNDNEKKPEAEKIKSFRELKIWKVAMKLVKKIYQATKTFPKEELYGLSSQMRRAAVSIPSNVAEGFRRQHNNEFKQFLFITLGSCAELETQSSIAKELNYINESQESDFLEDLDHICRMTANLVKKL
ncbi:MAG: four helix bundle protein [Sedimentisphaerales bacterium]|nr:four helix bundle protein [Sedimentisphaerales bacterium]